MDMRGPGRVDEYVIEFEPVRGPKMRIHCKDHHSARLGGAVARPANSGSMIQITPQTRVLVARRGRNSNPRYRC